MRPCRTATVPLIITVIFKFWSFEYYGYDIFCQIFNIKCFYPHFYISIHLTPPLLTKAYLKGNLTLSFKM